MISGSPTFYGQREVGRATQLQIYEPFLMEKFLRGGKVMSPEGRSKNFQKRGSGRVIKSFPEKNTKNIPVRGVLRIWQQVPGWWITMGQCFPFFLFLNRNVHWSHYVTVSSGVLGRGGAGEHVSRWLAAVYAGESSGRSNCSKLRVSTNSYATTHRPRCLVLLHSEPFWSPVEGMGFILGRAHPCMYTVLSSLRKLPLFHKLLNPSILYYFLSHSFCPLYVSFFIPLVPV